ncbi:MAG: DNA-3-methyladenine glycosylase I [Candidatus Ozemobacteraceae bacterium]
MTFSIPISRGTPQEDPPKIITRCAWANTYPSLREYHDNEYGFRIKDDHAYFERLILELFQAGLSWRCILEKRPAFHAAFANFDPQIVAGFDEKDVQRLMDDAGIVRNRRKIESSIENARRFNALMDRYGSFDAYLATIPVRGADDDHPAVVKHFRSTFLFMGPLVVEEFLMSTGWWPVRHEPTCFLFPASPASTNLSG